MKPVALDCLISVVTPAFNVASVLRRAVESVAAQSAGPVEHIIVDDGSEDGTSSVLDALEKQYGHLRVVTQPRRGAAQARNAGIEIASGQYIAFLDADDEWRPDKLARQIDFMQQTGTVFSYGDYDCVREGSSGTIQAVRSPESLTHEDFLKGCPIGCLTVAYDQERLGKRFMPDVGRGHDWGLWLDLTRDGTVARRYPGIEAIYHVRPGSLSKRKLRKARDIYRLYRAQEGIGPLRSLWLLAIHSLNSMR